MSARERKRMAWMIRCLKVTTLPGRRAETLREIWEIEPSEEGWECEHSGLADSKAKEEESEKRKTAKQGG